MSDDAGLAALTRIVSASGAAAGTWRRGSAAKVLVRVCWPELAHRLDALLAELAYPPRKPPRPPSCPSGVSPSPDGRR